MTEPTKNPTVKAVEDLIAENATLKSDIERHRQYKLDCDYLAKEAVRLIKVAATLRNERNVARRELDAAHQHAENRGATIAAQEATIRGLREEVKAHQQSLTKTAEALALTKQDLSRVRIACAEAEKGRGAALTLAEVGKRAHENCFKRGFHKAGTSRPYLKRIAHTHEELDEALVAITRGINARDTTASGKPSGVLDEFADAIILISEMAYHYSKYAPGVTLDKAVADKLDYNDSRTDGINGNSL